MQRRRIEPSREDLLLARRERVRSRELDGFAQLQAIPQFRHCLLAGKRGLIELAEAPQFGAAALDGPHAGCHGNGEWQCQPRSPKRNRGALGACDQKTHAQEASGDRAEGEPTEFRYRSRLLAFYLGEPECVRGSRVGCHAEWIPMKSSC